MESCNPFYKRHHWGRGGGRVLQAVAEGSWYLTLYISPALVIAVNTIAGIASASLPLVEGGDELPRQTQEVQECIFPVNLWEQSHRLLSVRTEPPSFMFVE